MLPVGVATASGTLIGMAIGQGDVPAIKYYYKVSLYIACTIALLTVGVTWPLQNQIISAFTTVPGIVSQMKLAWPMLMLFTVFDTIQGVSQASVRSSGKQKLGAILISTGYFLIAIPITLLICFKFDWGISGIWFGTAIGVFCNTCGY